MITIKQIKQVLMAALILSTCCWNSCGGREGRNSSGEHRSDAQNETELANIFNFHRQLRLSDQARIDVLSWGAASMGGYLILLSDDSSNAYSAVSGQRDGAVVGCWVTDLDHDESFEVIVAMQGAGSGSYGTVVIYEFGHQGKFVQIPFPELPEEMGAGYMGHDDFSVDGDKIIRTFPIYQDSDPNAAPSGGVREIEHVMKNDVIEVLGSSERRGE